MEQYYEQSVAVDFTARSRIAYALCWLLCVMFFILAVIFAMGVVDEKSADLNISWISLIAAVLMLAGSFAAFRFKDRLHMEYDYIYQNGIIEVCGILNRRRRKKLLTLDANRILYAGSIDSAVLGRKDQKIHKWNAHGGSCCLCYMEGNIRHAALLDLDDTFAALLRRKLPAGTWHNGEGKY